MITYTNASRHRRNGRKEIGQTFQLDKINEWLKENPLKKWREENGISMVKLSSILLVSVTTIQRWESGATSPSRDGMEKIGESTGIMPETWAMWIAER